MRLRSLVLPRLGRIAHVAACAAAAWLLVGLGPVARAQTGGLPSNGKEFEIEDDWGVNLSAADGPTVTARGLRPQIKVGDDSSGMEVIGTLDNWAASPNINQGGFLSVDISSSMFLELFNEPDKTTQTLANDGSIVTFDNGNPVLAQVATYNAPNGDVGIFTPWGYPGQFALTGYTRANGENLTITNNIKTETVNGVSSYWIRVASVESSQGWMIKNQYQSDDPQNILWYRPSSTRIYNRGVAYCPADTTPCGATPQASLTYSYAAGPNSATIVTVTDQAGRTWSATNEAVGRKSAISLPSGDAISYAYPAGSCINHCTLTATRNGRARTYEYVTNALPEQLYGAGQGDKQVNIIDELGHQTKVYFGSPYYGLSIRPLAVTDALGQITRYEYKTPAGDVSKITFPEGNRVEFTYNARRNLLKTVWKAKPGSGLADIITSAVYPTVCPNLKTCNQPSSTIDARGNVTDYTYDQVHGGLLSVTRPAPSVGAIRPETRYAYTQLYAWYRNPGNAIVQAPTGIYKRTRGSTCQVQATCAGAADEVVETFGYQAGSSAQASNLFAVYKAVSAGDGSVSAATAMTYDDIGNMLTVDGPLPGSADTTMTRYDGARRVVGAIGADPDGLGPLNNRAVRTAYNSKGQVTSIEKGTVISQSDTDWAAMTVLEQTAYTYDAVTGEKLKEVVSGGGITYAVTQYSYDAEGRVVCSAQRMNMAAFGSLPASACTAGTSGGFGNDRITTMFYDAVHQPVRIQTGYGSAAVRDLVTRTYTPNGKLAVLTDANGNATAYEYDGFDRLSKTRFPSKTTVGAVAVCDASGSRDCEELSYDPQGNVTQRTLRDGQVIAFTFDGLGRQVFKNVPNIVTGELDVTTAYNNMDGVTSVTTSADSVSYGYDALGRTVRETGFAGQKTMGYDAAGRLIRLTWPGGFFVTYDYLTTGEVSRVRENGASSGVGVLAAYSYDSLGRRTKITRGNGAVTNYGYDGVSRLTTLSQDLYGTAADVTQAFTRSPDAEIVGRTRDNDGYAWVDASSSNLNRNYGVNGLNQYVASGAIVPTYDGRGNLTSAGTTAYAYTSENRLATAGSAVLTYDATGRLKQTAGTATTRFDYLGDKLIAELDGVNSVQRRYVPGPGVDEPVVWYEGSGTSDRRWLHADERGSVVAVSNSSGVFTKISTYDEYGLPDSTNLLSTAGRFQYTGQTWLPELGMYYYKARIYSPTFGRFLQTDPIGYDDQFNLYAYVGNDPVNGTDPSGTYGRGDGFTDDDQWKRFDRVQRAAAKDMDRRADKLESKAAKQDATAKPGGDQLRAQATALRAGAGFLKSDGSDGAKANMVSASDWTGSPNAAARVDKIGGNQMYVNRGHSAWGRDSADDRVTFIVGHESLHSAGYRHAIGLNGATSYRYSDDPLQLRAYRSVTGTPAASRDPDHLMSQVYP